MGYAQPVVGRAGTKGAVSILYRCQKYGLMPKDDFMWFPMRSRDPAESHKARTECCCASCSAPNERENGIVTMPHGDEEETVCR